MGRILVFAAACLLAGGARADLAQDLKKLADSVKQAKALWTRGSLPADFNLDYEIGALTRIIEDGKVNAAGRTVAQYYRGDAHLLVNAARVGSNRPPSVDASREALADYDRVIKHGKDIPDWGVDVANAAYYAGWIGQRYLRSEPLAYWYWEKCAEMGHYGCIMTVAAARVSGVGDVRIDADQALVMNEHAFGAGTHHGCAAAYAARNNALIIFFMKTKRPAKEAFDWVERSRRVLDSLAKEQNNPGACARARFDVIEYLMRYSADERSAAVLKIAGQRAESDEDRAVVRYLGGQLTEEQFREEISRIPTKPGKCGMHFVALWNAEVNRNGGVARDHFKAMQDLGVEACGPELAYAGKFNR
jgi:hypothetical protein